MPKKRIIENEYYDPYPRIRYRYRFNPEPNPIPAIPLFVKIILVLVVGAATYKTVADPMWTDRLIGFFNPAYLEMTEEMRKKERQFMVQFLLIIFGIVLVIMIGWVYTSWLRAKRHG